MPLVAICTLCAFIMCWLMPFEMFPTIEGVNTLESSNALRVLEQEIVFEKSHSSRVTRVDRHIAGHPVEASSILLSRMDDSSR